MRLGSRIGLGPIAKIILKIWKMLGTILFVQGLLLFGCVKKYVIRNIIGCSEAKKK